MPAAIAERSGMECCSMIHSLNLEDAQQEGT